MALDAIPVIVTLVNARLRPQTTCNLQHEVDAKDSSIRGYPQNYQPRILALQTLMCLDFTLKKMSWRDAAGLRVPNAVKSSTGRPNQMSKLSKGQSQRPRNPLPAIPRVTRHSSLASMNDSYGTNRMIRQAERVLQESIKLQPKIDFSTKVEKSHHVLTTHKELVHQSKKDIRKIPQPPADLRKERDPKLDDLQYEPLKGIGAHGPLKLLELLKTKRDNALKSDNNPPSESQNESLGEKWDHVVTMNSVVLDKVFRDLSTSSGARQPPSLTAMKKAKERDNASRSGHSANPGSPHKMSAKKTSDKLAAKIVNKKEGESLRKQHALKDSEDYFFRTHPSFMQMIDNTEDESRVPTHIPSTATDRKSQVLDVNTFTKKMEIKTATSSHVQASMADVLFKPATGFEFLESGPQSRTPSAMLELEKRIKGKVQKRRVDEASKQVALHVTNVQNPTYESDTNHQRRIKAEKDDQAMQYLRERPDNIRLFSSAAAERKTWQYSSARGGATATVMQYR